ncbi:hypothetical protein TL16_g08582 [Triparma laevis f. inornata]|uniref:GAT domain-containing protein n=2 Tax=Triparma laevis TaxID=1534972 RepID=A0A9W6ZQE9_9STRA|nr:hypothetical protein TrLO_g4759 [Triparma laevis f. longispina]GMH80530.1 hypothetical protein TL16_g08582 [Triparma laevis f. inornata]
MSVAIQAERNKKVATDLASLNERISLCADMQTHVSSSDEALLAVIGFLEACAPRVQQLIQAGAEGVLGEDTFMKCLEVNDRLVAILSDEGASKKNENEESKKLATTPKNDQDDLLLSVEEEIPVQSVPLKSGGGGGFNLAAAAAAADPFAGADNNLLLSPTPLKSSGMEDSKKPVAKMPPPNQPPLRAPSGGKKPGELLRAPSGQVDDLFSTLPPPPGGAMKGKSNDNDDLFDDFIGGRKGSKDGL